MGLRAMKSARYSRASASTSTRSAGATVGGSLLPSAKGNQDDKGQGTDTSNSRRNGTPVGCHRCLPSGLSLYLMPVGSTDIMKYLTHCN
jgi:hypothetical protein